MSDEELSQFYKYEADHFNEWLDDNYEAYRDKNGVYFTAWVGVTGHYKFTPEQMKDFMAVRNSPLYKALL